MCEWERLPCSWGIRSGVCVADSFWDNMRWYRAVLFTRVSGGDKVRSMSTISSLIWAANKENQMRSQIHEYKYSYCICWQFTTTLCNYQSSENNIVHIDTSKTYYSWGRVRVFILWELHVVPTFTLKRHQVWNRQTRTNKIQLIEDRLRLWGLVPGKSGIFLSVLILAKQLTREFQNSNHITVNSIHYSRISECSCLILDVFERLIWRLFEYRAGFWPGW